MALRLTKPWRPAGEAATTLNGHLGVYQLADAQGQILYIGFVGGHSRFGLKGEVLQQLEQLPEAAQFRVEITSAYLSRFRELMMVFVADHGGPPPHNPAVGLGRLSPA